MATYEGDTLTAANTITDADGLSGPVSYQWNRDGTPISGATSVTYTVGMDDVGAQISVTASYTDDLGTAESVTSAPTNPVLLNVSIPAAASTPVFIEGNNQGSGKGGYIPGDHWIIDDRTGFAIRESEAVVEWNGLVVHKDEWEPRHPSDFVRGVKDDITPSGPVRLEPSEDNEISITYNGGVDDPNKSIPEGTF